MAEASAIDLAILSDMDVELLTDIMSTSATYSLIEDAVQNLDQVRLDDAELRILLNLPRDIRMKLAGRLIELTELAREALRDLDGRVFQLTRSPASE